MSESKLGLGMSDYEKRNEELEQILANVMYFVDKWLEADDYDKDEVTRASIVYERISQRLKARDEKIRELRKELREVRYSSKPSTHYELNDSGYY